MSIYMTLGNYFIVLSKKKKGEPTDLLIYRPISLHPTILKIFERLIHNYRISILP